jgi:hypothetical protein
MIPLGAQFSAGDVFESEVDRIDHRRFGHDYGSLDTIFEFPDVPGPTA